MQLHSIELAAWGRQLYYEIDFQFYIKLFSYATNISRVVLQRNGKKSALLLIQPNSFYYFSIFEMFKLIVDSLQSNLEKMFV